MNLFPDLRQWLGAALLCGLPLLTLNATDMSGSELYEVRVAVEDRSASARAEGIREAGKQVLSRITGERYPEESELLGPLVDELERLVERYQVESGEDGELSLWVRFDAEAMDRLVRDVGQPLWGRERPRVLLWVALRDSGDRDVLTEEGVRDQAEAIVETARMRGLPMLFPLMDLEDRALVDFADIWGGFDDQVLEASARYSPNAILIGRVDHDGGDRWSARWTLYQPDGAVRWRSAPGEQDEVFGEGVHESADRLARRFAVAAAGGGDDRLRIRIQGLGELEDYVAVERYLRNLTPVEQLRLESLESDTAIFRLQARGGMHSVEQAITLGDRLVPVEEAEDAPGRGEAMVVLEASDSIPTYRVR